MSKAIELATRADRIFKVLEGGGELDVLRVIEYASESAAELRRLDAENAQLRAELEAIKPLEWALQTLVERCNNDAGLTNDDAVVSAEAALERLYKSRIPLPERKS